MFVCPRQTCDSRRKDKAKLSVNVLTDRFHCWVCGYGAQTLAPIMVQGSAEHREYVGDDGTVAPVESPREVCSSLPPGFMPLDGSDPHGQAPYLAYLRRRNVSESDRGLYRIGFAASGRHGGRGIVP